MSLNKIKAPNPAVSPGCGPRHRRGALPSAQRSPGLSPAIFPSGGKEGSTEQPGESREREHKCSLGSVVLACSTAAPPPPLLPGPSALGGKRSGCPVVKSRASCKGRGLARSACITRKRAVSSETEPSFFTPEFLEVKPPQGLFTREMRALERHPLFFWRP